MRNHVKRLFNIWRYYSFGPEAVKSCAPQIRSNNIQFLNMVSLLATVLITIFIFYPLFLQKNFQKVFVFIFIAVIQFGIFLYSRHLRKKAVARRDFIFLAYCILFFSLIFFGIYIGIIDSHKMPAVNYYIFLVFSQILFIFNPVRNLFLNIIALGLLCFFGFQYNNLEVLKSNIVNGVIAATVGMTFNWYTSHIMVQEMLASKKLEEERNRFKEQSTKDELTGLSNRRDFLNSVTFYTAVCQHVHQTVCVIMMDVDHFKNYNDFYGHSRGDIVLKAIGHVLKILIQEELVFAARVGGEEFIILWTENRLSEAERLALKLKQMINDLNIPHAKSGVAPHVTASYGLYFLRGGSMDTVDELYQKADQALYEAKKRGRNRIALVDSDDPSTFRTIE